LVKLVQLTQDSTHSFDSLTATVSLCQAWGQELGFSQIGVADIDLSEAEPGLLAWLAAGFHGEMGYMAQHGLRRARPAELLPGTLSVITARMDYLRWPLQSAPQDWRAVEWANLNHTATGHLSLYARGRDYHKVLRSRLQKLAERLQGHLGPLGYRVFTDSAPVLEVELATRSGLGWRGKHTLLLHRQAGSFFFLGEIYLNVALPPTAPVSAHCGACHACIDICPTQAIVAPYRLDARRCISYLTIEHDGPIPLALRSAMGTRIYGCDDCQLICPWNKFAQRSPLPDFDERSGVHAQPLTALLKWSEDDFLRRTEGSPIRRIGHLRWLRNVTVAAGNVLHAQRLGDNDAQMLRQAVAAWQTHPSAVVQEHVAWTLNV
jgi:epoxyqueuosine reductase